MKFKIGDRVKVVDLIGGLNLKGLYGTIINVFDRHCTNDICIEFDQTIIGGHNGNNKGKDGFCRFTTENKIELITNKKENNMKNLIKRLIDPEYALFMDEVMDSDGNLNMSDPRVQEALMKTDGFRKNLLDILNNEKEDKEL
jgi:hypothetical protein